MSLSRELPLLRHETIVLPQMRSTLPVAAELDNRPDRFLLAQPGYSRGTVVEVVERSTVVGKGLCATLRGLARAEIEPSDREGWASYELVPEEPASDAVPALADEVRLATGRPRWATRLADDHNVNANPLCWSDLVLTASNEGLAFGCARETGEIIWRAELGAPCHGPVFRVGKWALFVTMNGLCWVCPLTGRVEQRHDADQGMLWSVCVCSETVLALEHRAQHACHLQAFGPELLYQCPVPSFTHGYTWCSTTGYAYEASSQGLVILDPATGQRLVDVVGQLEGCTVHAEADTIYLIAGSPGQTPRLCALHHPNVPQAGPIGAPTNAVLTPPAKRFGCQEQIQGVRGYRLDGNTVLALPHCDRTVELVEVPEGTKRWRLAPETAGPCPPVRRGERPTAQQAGGRVESEPFGPVYDADPALQAEPEIRNHHVVLGP